MTFQLHPYFVLLAISALATLSVFVIIRQRSAPGSFVLSAMLFGMFIWGISYAFTWVFVSLEQKIFWLKIMYLGVVMVPGLFLIFTLLITHRDDWVTFRIIVLILIEPAISFSAVSDRQAEISRDCRLR